MPPRKKRGRKKATSVSKIVTRSSSSQTKHKAKDDIAKKDPNKKKQNGEKGPKIVNDEINIGNSKEENQKDTESGKNEDGSLIKSNPTIGNTDKPENSRDKEESGGISSKENANLEKAEKEADTIMKVVNETNNERKSIMSPIKSLQQSSSQSPLKSPLRSPLKRDIDLSHSTNGSPIKRRRSGLSPERDLDKETKSMEMSIGLLFQKKDLKGLTSLSQRASRRSAQTFENYKKLMDRRAKTAEVLISKLTKENKALKNTIKGLRTEAHHSSKIDDGKEINKWKTREAETRKKLESVEESKKNLETKLSNVNNELVLSDSKHEMIELLSGTACLDYEENEKSIIFELRQNGTQCTLYYQLIINKSEPSDLIYSPIQKKPQDWSTDNPVSWKVNMDRLHSLLPEYLLDNLTFPSNNLRNFYRKISKAVNGVGSQGDAS